MDWETIAQTLMSAFKVAVLTVNDQGRIVDCWGCFKEILHYDKEELRQTLLTDLFFPEDRQVLLPNIQNEALNKGKFQGRLALLNKKGQKVICECLLFKNGEWVYILRDLNEIISKEKHLRENLKLVCVGEIANLMAHHLRNSITGIGGFSQRALQVCSPVNEKCREYLEIIEHQASRLERLMKTIELFIYLPSPKFEPFVFLKLIKDVFKRWSQEFRNRRWRLGVKKSYRPLNQMIVGNRFLLEMTIDALLKYAYNFTQPQETIGLFLGKGFDSENYREYIEVTVKANTKKELTEFKVINQLDDLFDTTDPQEVGIGLKLAEKILEIHSGKLVIAYKPNQAIQIIITLPIDRRRKIRYALLNDSYS